MLEGLTSRFGAWVRKWADRAEISERNIAEMMQEVRKALLEADVGVEVVRDFLRKVEDKAIGSKVLRSVSPGQMFVKIVHDELVALMGSDASPLNLTGSPAVVMLVGLQGSGKTTTAAKLAALLKKRGRHPMLIAADLQRPAAVEQLKILGEQIGVPVFTGGPDPVSVAEEGVSTAFAKACDVVVLDTAGRLHVDDALMDEVCSIAARVKPSEVLLVVDSLVGQDAVRSAAEFDRRLPLTGVILTKMDGDARGGAALSVKAVTGKPVKLVGVGEGIDKLEDFVPERMASRILGMGDVVGLVEQAQEMITAQEAETLRGRFVEGKISLNDWLDQFQRIRKKGSIKDFVSMIPGFSEMVGEEDVEDAELTRTVAIIQSMTLSERDDSDMIDLPRRSRIARGSGVSVQAVNQVLNQFRLMREEMSKSKGLFGRIKGMFTGAPPAPEGPPRTPRFTREEHEAIRERRRKEREKKKKGRR